MGAWNEYLTGIKGALTGPIVLGGTLIGSSENVPTIIAQQVRGGWAVLDTIDTLVDLPYELLVLDMEITVKQYVMSGGVIHPRTRYRLIDLPAEGTRVNEVPSYVLTDYWEALETKAFSGDFETQYAPNYGGKRPKFLPTEITSAAYQAGYPTTEAYDGGNPDDKIWVADYDPLLGHAWTRQRISGTNNWGVPVSLNAAGDYEQNQYLDTIFKWVSPKGSAPPSVPIQPSDYTVLPTGWQNTPGDDYATRILTEDLYRSTALRNPYGVLKSNWDVPILVSSDPELVRYGNTPGNTDYLNNTYWRGYYTPGLDTHQATRSDALSSDWTIIKIDQESGEFPDFVFKNFAIGISNDDLVAAIPTVPYPVGGAFPNDAFDAPPAPEANKIMYQSKATKYPDGSLKTPWSLWRRFDGLNVIQALLEYSPGDTFYKTRNSSGNLVYAFSTITITAVLYSGNEELTTGFNSYKWYRGATQILFDPVTRLAINLGVSLNPHHQVSVDGKSLLVGPDGFDSTQEYRVGINHVTRVGQDYEANIQLKDSTDDASAFMTDILAETGTVFKNGTGLKRFDAKFYKGGLESNTSVSFAWTIKNAAGAVISGGLRNSSGVSVGGSAYVATTVYVSGVDVDQFATLELVATFGTVSRTDRTTLTDVNDAVALEVLYWGSGSTDPGNPTDFTPRTLTSAQVLALGIGYSADAAGKWYMIHRIDGVWGSEIQIRNEAARPNAGLFLQVYKNVEFAVTGAPAAPAVPGSGSIIPSGWTQVPSAFAGSEDRTYMSVCFFNLRTDVAADPLVLTRDNYNPAGTFSAVKLVGVSAPPPASPGAAGTNGWSPIMALETRASDGKAVLKVISWTGGTGSPPASNTSSSYVGASGLTTIDAALALTGPAGSNASVPPSYYNSLNTKIVGAPTGTWVNSSGVFNDVSSGDLIVTNTYGSARRFLITAEIPVQDDAGGSDSWCARLYGRLDGVAAPGTIYDVNYSQQDGTDQFTGGVHKLKLSKVMLIQPGVTWRFSVRMAGTGSKYNVAFMEAIGI